MKNVSKMFRLGKVFENTEASLSTKPKKAFRRSDRWHFEKFKKKARKKADWSEEEEKYYLEALRECRENMLKIIKFSPWPS